MRIAFFGESFINGAGDPDYLGWVGRACAAERRGGHDITCYNLGIRGETSDRLRRRWRAEAELRLPPELDPRLVFAFGVNDVFPRADGTEITLSESLANTRAILTEARTLSPVLMVGLPPIEDDERNDAIAELSRAFAGLCAEIDVPFLDVFAPLVSSAVWRAEVAAVDGAHPGAAGYAELARLVVAWPAWRAWFDVAATPSS